MCAPLAESCFAQPSAARSDGRCPPFPVGIVLGNKKSGREYPGGRLIRRNYGFTLVSGVISGTKWWRMITCGIRIVSLPRNGGANEIPRYCYGSLHFDFQRKCG